MCFNIIDCGSKGYSMYDYYKLDVCNCYPGFSFNGSSCVFIGCDGGSYWDSICKLCIPDWSTPGMFC